MTQGSEPIMWMECFAGDARIEGDDVDVIADRFVAHADEKHDWQFREEALRNYARNYAEANLRLTGPIDRLDDIGEVTVHPVTADLIDDWIDFFDHDGFAGNPDWASCYCLEPHLPAGEDNEERPWREVRAAMVELLTGGGAFGYLAYVEGRPVGWVNASFRSAYGLYASVDPHGPDPASVIGVSCFLISPPHRRHGVAARLLDRVVADASERGAEWVEGYPYNEPEPNDPGHFRGPRHVYEARGFEPVEERAKYTVMRIPAPG